VICLIGLFGKINEVKFTIQKSKSLAELQASKLHVGFKLVGCLNLHAPQNRFMELCADKERFELFIVSFHSFILNYSPAKIMSPTSRQKVDHSLMADVPEKKNPQHC